MGLVLRIFFQTCFPSIKIVSFILPIYNSYTAFRKSLQICIRNSVARADEYDIESCEHELIKVMIYIIADNIFSVVATKKTQGAIVIQSYKSIFTQSYQWFFAYPLPCK